MFLCCGEALMDLLAGADGAPPAGPARIGGAPLNVAVGLARLGRASAWLGTLSTDTHGQAIAAHLRNEGVDFRLATRVGTPTPLAVVTPGADGSPSYAFHGLRDMPAPDIPALPDGVRVVHLGSVAAACGPAAAALEGFARAAAPHCLISYDPNIRPAVEPDRDHWQARVAALARLSHVVKISAEDLAFLAPGVPAEAMAERWLLGATRLVVVTHGPGGATAYTRHETVSLPGHQVVVADTVGAGDTFQAALLCGLASARALTAIHLDGLCPEGLRRVLAQAICASALACTRPGAAMPTRAQVVAARRQQKRLAA